MCGMVQVRELLVQSEIALQTLAFGTRTRTCEQESFRLNPKKPRYLISNKIGVAVIVP